MMMSNAPRERWIESVELNARLAVAQAVAREAGRLAMSFLLDRSKLAVKLKGPQDFVTSADQAVEKLVVERLSAAFPNDGFVGEEGVHSSQSAVSLDCTWIIDPIDGTANFAGGRADWCVSIGLVRESRPILGVIYHPTADQLFAAATGRGAMRDGAVMRTSTCATLSEATIALEYSLKTPAPLHLAQVGAVLGAAGEYRRNGSAALSLAHVADGRLDGFVELHVYPWDVVAGMVLVAEAGGWTSSFPFEASLAQPSRFMAGSVHLRTELLRLAELGSEQSRA